MKNLTLILAIFSFFYSTAQVNLSEGLIALYKFSNNANDESGNGNHSSLLGNATFFDVLACGDNNLDGLSLPHSVLDGLNDFSIGFDIKFDTFHGNINISGKTNIIISGWRKFGTNPVDNELNIEYLKHGISDNQTIENSVRIFFDNQRYTFPFVNLSEEVWYNFILTRSSDILELYVNGVKIGSGLTVSDAPISLEENGLIIGQEQDVLGGGFATDQSMAGQMDNLCIFNRTLTHDEVNEINLNSHSTIVSIRNIKNSELNKMIQIFPNPFNKDEGILSIRNENHLRIEFIKVYDSTGKLIGQSKIESEESMIQFYPLKKSKTTIPGILLINVIFRDGKQISYKVMQKNI